MRLPLGCHSMHCINLCPIKVGIFPPHNLVFLIPLFLWLNFIINIVLPFHAWTCHLLSRVDQFVLE